VRHHYRYVYTGAISDVKQRLMMIPPDQHLDQLLVDSEFDVRGASGRLTIDWETDLFRNRVCRVEAEHVDRAIDFEAWFSVRRGEPLQDASLDPQQLEACLGFTPLTAPDARLHAAALDIGRHALSVLDCAERAHDWAARSITYQLGVTGTRTPAAMALHLGQGVCQDYAHIMLSLLRCLGIPARYVSGHLLGDGAPHAWVEVLAEADHTGRAQFVAYDPTHHRRADRKYIMVATGRDFADVSSTSGVFTGAAIGKLHWSKQAEVVDDRDDAAA
jgi:transglutaminase-like putative cysteine protease